MPGKQQILYKTAADLCLDVIAGKWKILIIQYLEDGPCRLSDFLEKIPGSTKRVLIRSLRELEEDKIITREELQLKPPHIEYDLTSHGKSLKSLIESINNWGLEHVKIIYPNQTLLVAEDFPELKDKVKLDKRFQEIQKSENIDVEKINEHLMKSSKRVQDIDELKNKMI